MWEIDVSTLGNVSGNRQKTKRNRRIKSAYESKDLDRFYRILTNTRSPARGRETIIVSPGTFSKIFWKIDQIQCKCAGYYMVKYGCFSQIILDIYNGASFSQLGKKIPSQVIISVVRITLAVLAIPTSSQHRVSLRSIHLSGFLARVARDHKFDLKAELNLYKIPYI